MVTASGTVTDRVVGLELGADDYVVKPFATGEVIARIRAVLRRGARRWPTDEHELDFRSCASTSAPGASGVAERELELTRKEFDLLARLARDAGRVVTRESLMSDVWDLNWFGSTKTLDVHIAWLRRKLGDDPARPSYIHTVRGRRLPPGSESGAGAVGQRDKSEAPLVGGAHVTCCCWRSSRSASRSPST